MSTTPQAATTPNSPDPWRGGVALANRRGKPISNQQSYELDYRALKEAEQLRKTHFDATNAWPRAGPSPLYNCHGLTLACRRAFIWDPVEVASILAEDNYHEISEATIQPGDLAVYYDDRGDISHTGIVVQKADSNVRFDKPMIVSKWGGGEEWIHKTNKGPYGGSPIKYFRIDDSRTHPSGAIGPRALSVRQFPQLGT